MAMRGRKKVLSTLRSILRHVAPVPGGVEPVRHQQMGTSWRAFVVDQYREHAAERDKRQCKMLRQRASDYNTLLLAGAEQQRLRRLDMGADRLLDASERARRSAQRVGLQVPKVYDENEHK
jgi:hypothetical protein